MLTLPKDPMAPNRAEALQTAKAPCSAVLFDGSCPLCSREIAMYRTLTGAEALEWVNIADPGYVPPAGTTQNTLMQRFHVVRPDGVLISGARAFVHIWSQLAGWRYVAHLARLPGVAFVLEGAYCLFLTLRPTMQRCYAYYLASTLNAGKPAQPGVKNERSNFNER